MTELEYNISSAIAKLIADFKGDYDCVKLELVSNKNKKEVVQTVFFMDKKGKLLNGKKL